MSLLSTNAVGQSRGRCAMGGRDALHRCTLCSAPAERCSCPPSSPAPAAPPQSWASWPGSSAGREESQGTPALMATHSDSSPPCSWMSGRASSGRGAGRWRRPAAGCSLGRFATLAAAEASLGCSEPRLLGRGLLLFSGFGRHGVGRRLSLLGFSSALDEAAGGELRVRWTWVAFFQAAGGSHGASMQGSCAQTSASWRLCHPSKPCTRLSDTRRSRRAGCRQPVWAGLPACFGSSLPAASFLVGIRALFDT